MGAGRTPSGQFLSPRRWGRGAAHLACLLLAAAAPAGPLDREARQWQTLEWTVRGRPGDANPFDVRAAATFVHADGKDKRTTGLFYRGGRTWAFRFTPTRPGRWTFATSGDAPGLAGRTGTVTVAPAAGRGFVTGFGEKWGWSGTGEVFIPQLLMYATPEKYHERPKKIDADIATFLRGHGFSGFHTCVFARWFDLNTDRVTALKSGDPNPDPRTFEALELLIRKTYAAGGMVHLWIWGDESRRQTPIRIGGKNGPADLRLQRYIAARLGPLPGWTAGYGFDLHEWAREEDLARWHRHMHERLGWPHMLGGRAHKNRLTQIAECLDYSGYEQHRPDFATYLATIRKRPGKPSFSEDRFRIRQGGGYAYKDYDMAMTRRGLWRSALAGGVANIWGRLDGRGSSAGSLPYARPEWIGTCARFFRRRFRRDSRPAEGLSDGACLARTTRAHYVFYREDADGIRMDLTGMRGRRPAVAVDALRAYREIDIGPLAPARHAWKAPRKSDWAVAVGDFGVPPAGKAATAPAGGDAPAPDAGKGKP